MSAFDPKRTSCVLRISLMVSCTLYKGTAISYAAKTSEVTPALLSSKERRLRGTLLKDKSSDPVDGCFLFPIEPVLRSRFAGSVRGSRSAIHYYEFNTWRPLQLVFELVGIGRQPSPRPTPAKPPRMADKIYLRLSDLWALGYDDLQWIVMHYRPPRWRSISFVASTKVVLMRVLEETGAKITPEAQTALDHLPDTFKEFIIQKMGDDAPDWTKPVAKSKPITKDEREQLTWLLPGARTCKVCSHGWHEKLPLDNPAGEKCPACKAYKKKHGKAPVPHHRPPVPSPAEASMPPRRNRKLDAAE